MIQDELFIVKSFDKYIVIIQEFVFSAFLYLTPHNNLKLLIFIYNKTKYFIGNPIKI
jgi:hypothetical protein